MQRFYISQEAGNDAWSGTAAAPNAESTDGPFRTLSAAQNAVRQIQYQRTEQVPIEVVISEGTYPLADTWRFGALDSGFGRRNAQNAQTCPVVWRAAAGERVVISGGRRIEGWQPALLNGRAVWRAETPWVDSSTNFFRQLWIGDERRPRARLPKNGTFRVAEAPDANFVGGHGQTVRCGSQRFVFHTGDLSALWKNPESIDVQFRGWWMSPRVGLLRVDEANSTAWLDRNTTLRLAYTPNDGLDYILENVSDALTEPGEWCLSPKERCVWYLPLPGERPEDINAFAGGIDTLLEISGAKWLRFENIIFAHAEWRQGPLNAVSEQSSVSVTAAVTVGRGCEGVVFNGCRIEHVGGYGLDCTDGATDVMFQHGVIRDLGAGGVKILDGCRRCVIEDCEIADGGHLWMSGAGVVIGRATGNAVRHCHIHDFYYTGISVGWSWGYAEGDAYGNVIEWNHIHHIGKAMLSDMGGVYLLGNAMGTRVRYNRIHDIRSLRYGGWAIYPDEGSSDLLIENNLCYNTDRELFHQHYGRNNTVCNNVFAYGGEAVLAYTRMEEHVGLVFERNIFVARGTPVVKGVSAIRWRPPQTVFDANLYWCEDGPVWFEQGQCVLATQPFVLGYATEAERFLPLPADGCVVSALTPQGATEATVLEKGEFRFAYGGHSLTITGRFIGSHKEKRLDAPLWERPRIEVFLKPFPDCPAMAQFGAATDGTCALVWHGCDAAEKLTWQAKAETEDSGWTVTLTVPLDAIDACIRKACTLPDARPTEWRYLAGATLPATPCLFTDWKRHCGDSTGIMADPGFGDPSSGNFRIEPDSPACSIGFVPFDLTAVGPRSSKERT